MVKSLHRSLEAKLASIKDPEHSESDDSNDEEPEAISAKRTGKGAKRKGRKKPASQQSSTNDDDAHQPSTVIYLGHLPVGFEERELTVFLNQFGNVKRCRVSRSTKTGRSRGYAFVDFADADVARIVAETMSGYFLLEKRLVCHLLPKDKVHELMFKRPRKVLTKADRQKAARAEVNKKRSAEALKGITKKLVRREEGKRKKLAALGIDYDFPGYTAGAAKIEAAEGAEKKRKLSDVAEEEDDNEPTTPKPKSEKKKKRKSKRAGVEEGGEEEKENDATPEAAAVTQSSKKKQKKAGKTPKKAKTPKK